MIWQRMIAVRAMLLANIYAVKHTAEWVLYIKSPTVQSLYKWLKTIEPSWNNLILYAAQTRRQNSLNNSRLWLDKRV